MCSPASTRATVDVVPGRRVAVLSTGDELVDGRRAVRPGQIRESNAAMLAPLLAEAGCVVDLGHRCPTTRPRSRRRCATPPRTCDAVVTSGGVSMGDFDVVKAVLDRIADMRWMQIAIKPAKPFAFGMLDGTPVFGLPGNPVSSMVSFELLARPALRQMMGHRHVARPQRRRRGRRRPAPPADGKIHFVRVTARSPTTAGATSARPAGRAATNWPPRRWPMRSPSCPTATASRPAPTSPCCCSTWLSLRGYRVRVVAATCGDLVDPFGRVSATCASR